MINAGSGDLISKKKIFMLGVYNSDSFIEQCFTMRAPITKDSYIPLFTHNLSMGSLIFSLKMLDPHEA